MTTLTLNEQYNGIEIAFDCRPIAETLQALKSLGFRWHGQKKIWYAKNTSDRLTFAQSLASNAPAVPVVAKEKKNKFGVKVGDIFYASWGYEQTNVDFFQVIELKGESSVIVREVSLEILEETPTCSMAADRKYKLPSEILKPANHSTFINDNEKGDLRRVSLGYNDEPYINVGRKNCYQTTARPYRGQEVYVSWYY